MCEVKRYNYNLKNMIFEEAPDGIWVSASDYDALQKEYNKNVSLIEPSKIVDDFIDCGGDLVSIDGDESFYNITIVDSDTQIDLWYYLKEFFQDYSETPDPIKLTNVSINGDLWSFTINATHTYPAQDFGCYGKWFVDEITITDKVME